VKRTRISVRCSGLINRPKEPFHKPSWSQTFATREKKFPPPEEKISLFRNLFRGREDVVRHRWESKGGKSGYSHCRHHGLACHPCRETKKSERRLPQTRMLQPLTDDAIQII